MMDWENSARPDLRDPALLVRRLRSDLSRAFPGGWQLFRARLSGQTSQSFAGWLWLFLPTVAIALTALAVQQRGLVNLGQVGMAYPAFVLSGLVAWQIFADAFDAPMRRIDSGRPLITHSDAPVETLLVAALCDTMLAAVVRIGVLVPVMLLWAEPAPAMLLVIPAAMWLVLVGTALSMLVAPLALLYSDLRQSLSLTLQLGMFATPVFYLLPARSPWTLNPVRAPLEGLRSALTGGGVPHQAVTWLGGCVALFVLGWLVMRIARPLLAERLG